MIKLLYVIVITIVIFIGLTFTYMNNQVVTLNYFGFQGAVHLSWLLLGTLTVGTLCGYVAGFAARWKTRRTVARLQKELRARTSQSV